MTCLINGNVATTLAATDRATQYGDAVFETVAVVEGEPLHWQRHWQRLLRGLDVLRLPVPDEALLRAEAREILAGTGSGVLKILITAGSGGRGYRRPARPDCQRILSLHPLPSHPPQRWSDGVTVRVCRMQLAQQPVLAGLKHGNRLEQVLARAEWEAPEIAEGLMCDTDGALVEGTMSNIFAVRDGGLETPELSRCGVAGVMREVIMELATEQQVAVHERRASLDHWLHADALFLCNSVIGIWPVANVDGRPYPVDPLTRRLCDTVIERGLAPSPAHFRSTPP